VNNEGLTLMSLEDRRGNIKQPSAVRYQLSRLPLRRPV